MDEKHLNSCEVNDLSIIILSYNTKDTTLKCLSELDASLTSSSINTEVIVCDNASTDGSHEELTGFQFTNAKYKYLHNKVNVGFSRGNNQALQFATGKYILYLNSDVMVGESKKKINWRELLATLDSNPKLSALTVRVDVPDKGIDKASHRGFPTPTRSLWYFLGIEKLLEKFQIPNSKFQVWFGGYHLLHLDLEVEHEIEACTAAFMLCKSAILKELRGFDEKYFMYGEDLDLCYRMHENGYQILWYPKYSVLHLKYKSGLSATSEKTRIQIKLAFYEAMWIFYNDHYKDKYASIVTLLVKWGIMVLAFVKTRRVIRL